uniref:Uncharacterized protein n=1 Tax=virus sp. ctEQ64 TaxID=2825809 RepID=A0A8S5RKD7_9VIRU|nr:MAG TPA: hypothetical protein [virus sp. ctEQ64]
MVISYFKRNFFMSRSYIIRRKVNSFIQYYIKGTFLCLIIIILYY